jgi:uncharacterized ion transporter superfamily protein YfcC
MVRLRVGGFIAVSVVVGIIGLLIHDLLKTTQGRDVLLMFASIILCGMTLYGAHNAEKKARQ